MTAADVLGYADWADLWARLRALAAVAVMAGAALAFVLARAHADRRLAAQARQHPNRKPRR